jgi:hypothetical protein
LLAGGGRRPALGALSLPPQRVWTGDIEDTSRDLFGDIEDTCPTWERLDERDFDALAGAIGD